LAAVMMAVQRERWKPRAARGVLRGPRGAAAHERRDEMMDDRFAPQATALLRVSMGVMFLAHGLLLKLMTFGLAGTMGFFGQIGYPPVLGAVVAIAETAAGVALIAGLWTRWVSLAMVPIMAGAVLFHLPQGWVFSAPGGGWEFPAFWTIALIVQAGLGAGAWALDNRLSGAARAVPA
jgi:putative oxidoreductase